MPGSQSRYSRRDVSHKARYKHPTQESPKNPKLFGKRFSNSLTFEDNKKIQDKK